MLDVIAISGHLASGKTTLAKALSERGLGTRVALADALKDDVAAHCLVTRDYLDTHKGDFRVMLQEYGVLMRELHGHDYWVNRLKESVLDRGLDKIIVDDVRFPNELMGLRLMASRFYSVRLELDEIEQTARCITLFGAPLSQEKLSHSSETYLDLWLDWSLTIDATLPTADQVGSILLRI